jgi:hypothetical protein
MLSTLLVGVLVTQGVYYLATGVWPLVSIRSFQMVTGPKTDLWLVRTVGVLVSVIGIALLIGATPTAGASQLVLAIGCAIGLACIDIFYAVRGIIARIYLCDAIVQVVFVAAISVAALR